MRQIEPRQWNSSIILLIGIIVGLSVGLLVGWVIWPVEWQGATLNELFPTDKAEYLAAVADAYALNRTPEAVEIAQRRVAPLGNNLSTELAAAIAHFSAADTADRELRIGNLSLLASTLGVSTPTLVGVTQDTAPADSAAAPVPDAAATPPDTTTTSSGWLTWLLYVLAGVLLILAGLYVILRLRQQRQSSAQLGEHIDREIGALQQVAVDPWERRTHSYVAAEDDPAQDFNTTGNGWQNPTAARVPEDEYSFDDDPEEPSHVRSGANNWVGANRGNHVTQLRLDEEQAEADEDFVEEEGDEEAQPSTPYRLEPGGAGPSQSSSRIPGALSTPSETALSPSRPAAAFSLSSASTERPAAARAVSKNKLLEIYTAQYQVGLRDYDESHPIMDPVAGKYVGECGMGTSTKNGLLQNNPDQVVALEVWLFDKTDEKNVGTQTRVLLSEYAIDHNLVQAFTKERQDDPRPFTAQPNTRFQLESQNLLLDCTITEASYASSGPTKGIFQNVTVEMSVYKKG